MTANQPFLTRASVQGVAVTMRVEGKSLPQWLVDMAIALAKRKREFLRYDLERMVERETSPTARSGLQHKATTVLLQGLKKGGLIRHVGNGVWQTTDRVV